MNSEITLEEAITKIYNKTYKRIKDISSSWYLFTPYENRKTHETSFFKLL